MKIAFGAVRPEGRPHLHLEPGETPDTLGEDFVAWLRQQYAALHFADGTTIQGTARGEGQ